MTAEIPEAKVVRHRGPDRAFHWVMAVSVLTLLGTAFLPIIGIQFAWVTIHWIAGVVLTAAVLFHIVRALFWQDLMAMVVVPRDLRDAWRSVRLALGASGPAPDKPGKYPFLQKLYHLAILVVILTTVVTGLMMMTKIDTPFWARNPYWLADGTWGWIYVIHGLAAMTTLTLVMMHVYFAVRPEKLWITRSMIVGWITRREFHDHHDPAKWSPAPGAKPAEGAAETRAAPPGVAARR